MNTGDMTDFVAESFAAQADDLRAEQMAAYLKTDMPFYGVSTPDTKPILKELYRRFPVGSVDEYRSAVAALWEQPHREEKHVAIRLARRYSEFIRSEQLDLYERLIVEGAWWDFVDDVAINLVGKVLLDERPATAPLMAAWIVDDHMWRRRTAIISQLKHKVETDVETLFSYCLARSHEKEFFIRKAIGWALREYAKTDPEAVRSFVEDNKDSWSGLTYREATKHL